MKTLQLLLVGVLLVGVLLASAQVWAGCLDAPRLAGVNMSGAEFNAKARPGVINKDYVYPTEAELRFVREQDATLIRLPIRWERIQNAINEPLNAAELARIQETVKSASSKGLCVLLDIHNYATYNGVTLAANPELQDAFVDLWLRLAHELNNPDTVMLGLMNEPSHMPIADWAALAKRTLAELRSAGVKNVVMVAGGRWSGVHDWFSPQGDGVSSATAFANLKDPLNRAVLEVHQYADKDFSGTSAECYAPEKFTAMFTKITAWAKTHQQHLFLGEFGTSRTPACLATLEQQLSLMDDPVWRGWAYWVIGRWWAKDYPYLLNTSNMDIAPQWIVLRKYLHYPLSQKSVPKPPIPVSK